MIPSSHYRVVVTELEDMVFCTGKFNLTAITNHSENLNSGHYTCLVKDGETWWHFSDEAVVAVNKDDINKLLPDALMFCLIRLHKNIYIYIFGFSCFCVYLPGGLTDQSYLWKLTLPPTTLVL